MNEILTPKNRAERRFLRSLESGDVRPEFVRQELARRMGDFHNAVSSVAPEAVRDVEPTLEVAGGPLTPMPFAELQTLLALKGVDLQKQLDEHVAFMIRRGVVQPEKSDEYKAKFNTISVRKSELENIPKGYRPMLFIDDMTPAESAEAFDVPLLGPELSNFTKRDLNNVDEPLPNQNPSGLTRLTFTPDVANLTSNLIGLSADAEIDQMKRGKHFMEPAQYFQFFAECLERAIKELNLGNGKDWKDMTDEEKQTILANKAIDSYLPDLTTCTQFPAYRKQSGYVLDFCWHAVSRKVGIRGFDWRAANNDLGVRPLLG